MVRRDASEMGDKGSPAPPAVIPPRASERPAPVAAVPLPTPLAEATPIEQAEMMEGQEPGSPAPLAAGSSPSPGVEEPTMVRHDAGEMEAKASPPPPAAITPIAKPASATRRLRQSRCRHR